MDKPFWNPWIARETTRFRPNPTRWRLLEKAGLLSLDPTAEQDYFPDGMTEALITNLSEIGALRVISRTSVMRYKGRDKPLPEIARELNGDVSSAGD